MAEIVAESSNTEEVVQAIVTPSIRIEFAWRYDRWVHALVMAVPEGPPAELVHSVDRLDGGETVALPAYQQLHIQAESEAHHAMLVGQSGPHHFSATFTVREEGNGVVSIEVDVADRRLRTGGEAEPLACAYEVRLPLGSVEEASHRFMRWSCAMPAGHLNLAAAESSPTPTIVVLSKTIRGGSLAQPIARFVPEAPAQRCRYRWTWEPARPAT
jgi:hypothetical protein